MPVVFQLKREGYETYYSNSWLGIKSTISWADFLARSGKKALLLSADWNTSAHSNGVKHILEAQAHGIPSISIQHGEMLESDPEPMADVQCIWGEYYKTSKCTNPIITGNPYLDNFDSYRGQSKYALFVASTHLAGLADGSRELYREQINRMATKYPVRLRPHLSLGEEMSWYYGFERIATVASLEMDLIIELARTKLVFGYSSVLIEAAVLGIPAIEVTYKPTPKVDNQIYYHYTTPLEEVVKGDHKLFAELHNGGLVGEATTKIVSVIKEYAQ
jgi:hypothetical protein